MRSMTVAAPWTITDECLRTAVLLLNLTLVAIPTGMVLVPITSSHGGWTRLGKIIHCFFYAARNIKSGAWRRLSFAAINIFAGSRVTSAFRIPVAPTPFSVDHVTAVLAATILNPVTFLSKIRVELPVANFVRAGSAAVRTTVATSGSTVRTIDIRQVGIRLLQGCCRESNPTENNEYGKYQSTRRHLSNRTILTTPMLRYRIPAGKIYSSRQLAFVLSSEWCHFK